MSSAAEPPVPSSDRYVREKGGAWRAWGSRKAEINRLWWQEGRGTVETGVKKQRREMRVEEKEEMGIVSG